MGALHSFCRAALSALLCVVPRLSSCIVSLCTHHRTVDRGARVRWADAVKILLESGERLHTLPAQPISMDLAHCSGVYKSP